MMCFCCFTNIYRFDMQVTFELNSHLLQRIYYIYCTYLQVLSYSVDFQAPQEFWNPLSKAVVYFVCLAGMVNTNVYKTRDNFHRSLAWQIVLISNTGKCNIFTKDNSDCWEFRLLGVKPTLSRHLYMSIVCIRIMEYWSSCLKFLI